jgi:hypothetical protein
MSTEEIKFTIPENVVGEAETILTVVAMQDGTYAIGVAKKQGITMPNTSDTSNFLFTPRILTKSANWIIHTEKALAVHLAYNLFNEHHWRKL